MDQNRPVLKAFILLITICTTACTCSPSLKSPLSPLSPLPPTPVSVHPDTATPPSSAVSTPIPTWTPPPSPALTSTPIPTTLPTATWTPVPTFTPQPKPDFPPEAVIPEGWPDLPTDVYFIRDGSLWRWPKEGQGLEQIVAAPRQSGASTGKLAHPAIGPGSTGVRAYRLTPDGRYLVYAFANPPSTPEPEMVVLDRTTGETIVISTAVNFEYFPFGKPAFDITPDGRYVVYIAWNVQPTTGGKSPGLNHMAVSPNAGGYNYGTIFAVDVLDINHEFELGYCAARSEDGWELRCDGFVLSPDGTRIAFSDGRGVWLAKVPQGTPHLIAEHQHRSDFCGVWRVRNWSPDGKRLLIDVGCFEGGYSAVMDADTGEVQAIPHSWSYPSPYVNIIWSNSGASLLVNHMCRARDCPVYLVQVPAEDPADETVVFSANWPSNVWPTEAHDLPDGRIAFANQQCVDGTGMQSGIYTIGSDGSDMEFVSPLPTLPCYVSGGVSRSWNTVLWSPDGTAYLYFPGNEQQPDLLGMTDGSGLWDVRELLVSAYGFQWQSPYSGYWR